MQGITSPAAQSGADLIEQAPELLRLALAAHAALQECTYICDGTLFAGMREDTPLSEDAYRTRQALVELAALAAKFD